MEKYSLCDNAIRIVSKWMNWGRLRGDNFTQTSEKVGHLSVQKNIWQNVQSKCGAKILSKPSLPPTRVLTYCIDMVFEL